MGDNPRPYTGEGLLLLPSPPDPFVPSGDEASVDRFEKGEDEDDSAGNISSIEKKKAVCPVCMSRRLKGCFDK